MTVAFTPPPIDGPDLEVRPIELSETIPSSWYTDPRFHELERRAVFSPSWQGIGHLCRLEGPQDQIEARIADEPIIVVRDESSRLRAFYNVCRHRGGPLGLQAGRVLQCRYHGWTYRLDGSLRGTPRFNRTDLFDERDFGLVPIGVDSWEGLLFVRLDDGGPPAAAFFGGVRERIAPFSIASKRFYRRVTYDVGCNWKVYVDNYLEGYHLPYVHPELCTLLDYSQYVTETFDWYSLQYSPVQDTKGIYNEGVAFYYHVWPNFMLNILPGRLQTNLVLPTAHNRCAVVFDYYYDDIDSAKARGIAEEDIAYSDRIQQEDIGICERVQQGLESRSYGKGRFSVECETGVYHFQALLKQAYRKALTG